MLIWGSSRRRVLEHGVVKLGPLGARRPAGPRRACKRGRVLARDALADAVVTRRARHGTKDSPPHVLRVHPRGKGNPTRVTLDCWPSFTNFVLAASLIIMSAVAVADEPAGWDPHTLARENTLEFLTVGPQEGEGWSRVWVVAVDDQLYVRLGRRAATRFEKNTTAPFVKVRISGHEFDHVRAEPAPEMAERVAAAMAAKYWSDLFHPLREASAHRAAERAPAMK